VSDSPAALVAGLVSSHGQVGAGKWATTIRVLCALASPAPGPAGAAGSPERR
jgi:hypothetical protein